MFVHNISECLSYSCTFLVNGWFGHIYQIINSSLNFFLFIFVCYLIIDFQQFRFVFEEFFKANAIWLS